MQGAKLALVKRSVKESKAFSACAVGAMDKRTDQFSLFTVLPGFSRSTAFEFSELSFSAAIILAPPKSVVGAWLEINHNHM